MTHRQEITIDGCWHLVEVTGPGAVRLTVRVDGEAKTHWWGHVGTDEIGFLRGLEYDYLMGKLGGGWRFDAGATISVWRRELLRLRRDRVLESDAAREMWDGLDSAYGRDADQFMTSIAYECPGWDSAWAMDMPPVRKRRDWSWGRWYDRVWPRVLERLRRVPWWRRLLW